MDDKMLIVNGERCRINVEDDDGDEDRCMMRDERHRQRCWLLL